ncbi:MAG: DAK2 domain-containing protein [Anaerolineae bacterium]
MVIEVKQSVVDGRLLKWMLAAGVSWLEHHKAKINNMNVFPVPDGDTGTNMVLTIRKAYQQIAHTEEHHIGAIAEQIARGALTGARGNSGTILSMLLRGFSQSLKGKKEMDAETFALACQNAVDYAYETVRSVMEPVEGTILTVAREAAAAIRERARTETDLKVLLQELIDAAYQSLENTPNLLPKLKEAGVVDSGGMGLVYILEGMKRFVDGEPVVLDGNAEITANDVPDWQDAITPDDEEGYGYDVQFLMIGENLNVQQVRADISAMGWSPLVDGDEQLIKVHIHVHNPAEPLDYAIKMGVDLDDIVVENMQAQYLQYIQARSEREAATQQQKTVNGVAIVTVARGDGLERIFDQYGAAYVIIGGQTMNPSTEDFLNAIEAIDNQEIILMPNNGNVIMAAEQAAQLTTHKTVKVLKTKTVQQGIAALVAYMDANESGDLNTVFSAMNEASHSIISAEVTTAVRNTNVNGVDVVEGHYIGMLNGKLVISGDNLTVLVNELLAQVSVEEYEICTLYYGGGLHEADAETLASNLETQYPDLEYQVIYGGQPLYPYLISLE